MVYVYIRFNAVEADFCSEPVKWRRMFRGEVQCDDKMFFLLASRMEYCWLSEHRNSLNLGLRMNQISRDFLKELCQLFPGAVEAKTFNVIPGKTSIPELIPEEVRSKATEKLSAQIFILPQAA